MSKRDKNGLNKPKVVDMNTDMRFFLMSRSPGNRIRLRDTRDVRGVGKAKMSENVKNFIVILNKGKVELSFKERDC